MRWVDKYKSTNNITRKKRNYTSYKITNNHISFIKQQLKQNKTITMYELLTKLKVILNVKLLVIRLYIQVFYAMQLVELDEYFLIQVSS